MKEKTALLIIDMQNKWIAPGKTLFPPAEVATTTINRLRKAWQEHGQPVIHITMVHEPDGSTLSKFDSRIWNVRGSEEAGIIPSLRPSPHERIIEKSRYSAFFKTGLKELMNDEGIASCVITGYQARACVLATALDAYQNDIHSIVIRDGILDTEKDYLDFYLKVFADAEVLKPADEAITLLVENNKARF